MGSNWTRNLFDLGLSSAWEQVELGLPAADLAARRQPQPPNQAEVITNATTILPSGVKAVWTPVVRLSPPNLDLPVIVANQTLTTGIDDVFPYGIEVSPP